MAAALAVSDGTANLVVMTPVLQDGDPRVCVGDPPDPNQLQLLVFGCCTCIP